MRLEPGGQDDHVEFALGAIHRHDPRRSDPVDAVGDNLDVGLLYSTMERTGQHLTLAQRLVVRGELLPQLLVADQM
ncbi:Uncharacterised protein [Mycobacteroides abscessus subsp. abscessus]|nr:Uncharacterised protein [Mycobacteroides abscessus subsp. abscessus]